MPEARNLLITGAAGDIGQAAARLLERAGYHLFLIDKDRDKLRDFAATLETAVAIVADATDAAALTDAFALAADGGLHGVVLAAGIEGPVNRFEDCADAAFDAVMTVNVKSVWLGLKRSLQVMKPQGYGSVVVLSSIAGVIGTPMLAPYAASKHAVMGLVRTAAREAAGHGVRINAVCPAPVDSAMMRRIDGDLERHFPDRLGGRSDAAKSVPMQRYATAEEVAQTIGFLCSDASSFCTGSAYMVDGGITCR